MRPFSKIRDKAAWLWMLGSMVLVLIVPVLIAYGLIAKSTPLFQDNLIVDILMGSDWKPVRGSFGFLPFIAGSVYVTLMALLIATPLCLLTAIYLTHYARKRTLRLMHPIIDILAGIPSVVYGVWGILVIVPLVSDTIAPMFGVSTSGYTLLSGALVLAVMIIPFILNIMIEVMRSIPEELTESSMALGATRWQSVKKVIMRKAAPGLASAVVFGLSRAFGETIAVLMVIGNVPKVPASVFDPAYPLPSLIANNYGEMLSIPRYDAALMFAALILFVIVLLFNLASRFFITRYEMKQKGTLK